MLAEGTLLERFEIVSVIDRGGMAFVYLARQADLKRFVAIKELHAFHLGDTTIVERFLREAQIGALLSHPNIVTLFETFEHDGLPYIVVEHVPRGSVRPLVGRLDTAQVAGVLEGVLAGLAHAETRNVVHRDLKPENLLVADDGTIKIGDFGIAKAFHQAATLGPQHLTVTGTELGTPAYMSPEQGLGRDVGPWTDLYSTGVIAYELLAGRTPFADVGAPVDQLMAHVQRTPTPLGQLRPDLDPRLAGWVEWLLAKEPARRPQSAREAWDKLEDIVIEVLGPRWRRAASLANLSTPPAAAPPPPVPAAPPPPSPEPDFGPGSADAFATFVPGSRRSSLPPVPQPEAVNEAPPPLAQPPRPEPPRSPGPPSQAPPSLEEGEFRTVHAQSARAEPPEAAPDLGIEEDPAFMTMAGHGYPAVPEPEAVPEEEWDEDEPPAAEGEEWYEDEQAYEEEAPPEPEPVVAAAPPPEAPRMPDPLRAQKASFMARLRNVFNRSPESLARNPEQLLDEPGRMLRQEQYDLARRPQNLQHRAENLARDPEQLLRNPEQLLRAPDQLAGHARSLTRRPALLIGAVVLVLAAVAALGFGVTRSGSGGGPPTTSSDAGNGKGTGTGTTLALPAYAKQVERILVLSHGAQGGLDRVIRDVHDSGRSGVTPAMAIKRTRTLVRTRTRAVALAKALPDGAPPELAPAIPRLRQAMLLELSASTGYLRWMRSLKPGADTYPYNDPAYQKARRFERRAEDLERRFAVRYDAVARDLKLKSFPPGTF